MHERRRISILSFANWRSETLTSLETLREVNGGRDVEARCCPGGGDPLDNDFVSEQGLAAPILCNEGEHAVLDAVPFAGAGWVMSDSDGQSGLIGEFLQLNLPWPDARSIAAAAIGGDEQAPGRGISLSARAPTLATDALHGEGCSVVIDADTDSAFVGGDVVDPIEHSALTADDEVVSADGLGSALAPQLPTVVLHIKCNVDQS